MFCATQCGPASAQKTSPLEETPLIKVNTHPKVSPGGGPGSSRNSQRSERRAPSVRRLRRGERSLGSRAQGLPQQRPDLRAGRVELPPRRHAALPEEVYCRNACDTPPPPRALSSVCTSGVVWLPRPNESKVPLTSLAAAAGGAIPCQTLFSGLFGSVSGSGCKRLTVAVVPMHWRGKVCRPRSRLDQGDVGPVRSWPRPLPNFLPVTHVWWRVVCKLP